MSEWTRIPLSNGWHVREREHPTASVRVEIDAVQAATGKRVGVARVHARVARVPAGKFVAVSHYAGASEDERQRALRHATRFAMGDWRYWPIWERRKMTGGFYVGCWQFLTTIGTIVDEGETFEALARSIMEPSEICADETVRHALAAEEG